MRLLDSPARAIFFTGKGGMGKTSIASATAVAVARAGRRVLIVSTDPASNLDEVLTTHIGAVPTPVHGVDGLYALNLDPEAAAARYRERVVGPYRGLLPDAAVTSIEEQLSGACTVEIAAFDEFAKLLGDPATTTGFDQVIFDTAPTGHTLRLLRLPSAWSDFIATNTTGTSCLGPLSGLEAQRSLYEHAVRALADPTQTLLVLVARPETSALAEAERTSRELASIGIRNQELVLNGVFTASADDPLAAALEQRQTAALAGLPKSLAALPRSVVPLLPFAPLGAEALTRVFTPGGDLPSWGPQPALRSYATLGRLADELSACGRGLVMTVGKGGVGKTTVAAALAVELSRRGHAVHLTTTDPAAHLEQTLQGSCRGLTLSRIDPQFETAAYQAHVLATAGAGLDENGRALLEEDLRSPCTEEIAVFRAFARAVGEAERGIVIIDTAPTGHTLLLLDAAEAYHHEVLRASGNAVPQEVANLLPRLRDPDFTRVLVITLPEATPVHEAARLTHDLARAGIRPFAWVVNQSFAPQQPSDPVLAARAAQEIAFIDEVGRLGERVALVPWEPAPPVGAARLGQLAGAA